MPESIAQPPLTFRKEIVAPLFSLISDGESCVIIGPANTGKTRLIDFVERHDVQQHYLGPDASATLIVRVDCNRLGELTAWGLYELMLTALLESCEMAGKERELPERAYLLREQTITSHDAFLAFRNLESAVQMVTFGMGKRICFLLDEFDGIYQKLPELDISHLRSLRDQNKKANYALLYVLLLREPLDSLRDVVETESFYELFSRSVLGLTPYRQDDARAMITQLEARKGRMISPVWCNRIIQLSGGHSGMVLALFDLPAGADLPETTNWLTFRSVIAECQKIWFGLSKAEHAVLRRLAAVQTITRKEAGLLALKGIILNSEGDIWQIFSPIFTAYVQLRSVEDAEPLWVDSSTRTVYVEGRRIKNLRPQVFKLVEFLYKNVNIVCEREAICDAIFPYGVTENVLDTLVKEARKEIETGGKPRYLLTVHAIGFRLVDRPETG